MTSDVCSPSLTCRTQATVQQGDAADEATIEGLVKRAMQEEGKLDVFFANVSYIHSNSSTSDPTS